MRRMPRRLVMTACFVQEPHNSRAEAVPRSDCSGAFDEFWRGRAYNGLRIGDQGYTRAHDHDPDAHPNPHDQRIQVSFNDGTAGVGIQSLVNQVKVFRGRGADAWNGLRLLAGLLKPPPAIHRSHLLPPLYSINI